jgi:sulfate permease, SulP family
VTVAFAGILYNHPAFAAALPRLSRLMVLANAAHQFVISMFSALPFAIAQVQDLGLIFLNAMASNIADRLRGEPTEKLVGTAVVASAVSTMVLGICLYFIGRCALVQILSCFLPAHF